MKTYMITVFSTLTFFAYGQQFKLKELFEMTNDSKIFEIKMISVLNQIEKKGESVTYSYMAENEHIGASPKLPTNNPKYEPLYRFDNGIVYSDSEIDRLKLDETYELRNRLRKEGGLINKASVDSFSFVKEKIINLVKYENKEIVFAENYDQEEKKQQLGILGNKSMEKYF